MSKKINFQFLISYFGLIPYVLTFLDKYYFLIVDEEDLLNFVTYYSLIIIVFIGSMVVIRPGFVEINLASLAALGTGVMYGFYLIITRKLSSSDNPLLTLLLTGVVGAIIISFVMPFVWIKPTLNQWSMMAAIGIFACVGHLFIILSLKYADASKLAPFSYFEIVTNIIIGYYFFSDFPDKWTFLGLFIIILSGIYISRRENIVKRLK